MTASRVVNQSGYASPEARERVETAVRDLGYQPNLAARAARSGTVRIGMLYSNPNSSNLSGFLSGAVAAANQLGCQLVVDAISNHASGLAAVDALCAQDVHALILPPPLCDDERARAVLRAANVEPIDFTTARPVADTSAILVDDFEGARLITERLIQLGHSRIAFVKGDVRHSTAIRREQGFREAMSAAGLAVAEQWVVDGHYTYRGGVEATRQLLGLRPRPTAIFASNDDMAAAAMGIAHGLNIAVPEQLSIAGFDDAPVATTIWPTLTTIRQPISEMAGDAVRLAMEQVRKRRTGKPVAPRHVFAELALVERESTAQVPE